jgi:stearoyl-CoA desaturase (delta-9 desaturase)
VAKLLLDNLAGINLRFYQHRSEAHDVPRAAILSMGESWHNNHHAFPASAQIGIHPGQMDIGFQFIQLLGKLGLAWDIQTPEHLPKRETLIAVVVQP